MNECKPAQKVLGEIVLQARALLGSAPDPEDELVCKGYWGPCALLGRGVD